MKRALSLVAVISIVLLAWSSAAAVSLDDRTKVPEATKPKVLKAHGKLPLSFEANRGQTDAQVKFLSRGKRYTLFLTPTEAILSSRRVTGLRMQLGGANQNPETQGLQKLPGKSHYFIGNDPNKWVTNIPMYAKVQYKDVYPGIDLIYYGNPGKLEYDFVVKPGADPKVITLAFEGIDKLQIDAQGDLVMHTVGGEVRWQKPVVYQKVDGVRKPVASSYVLRSSDQVGFQVAAYDSKKPLIIDPMLSYSTYLGGDANDTGFSIAVDAAGNAYVTGLTFSSDFPGTATMPGGGGDAFVTKLDPAGSSLVYSTYLGGTDLDIGRGIAVDAAGNAYVMGKTKSADFPTTTGAFQRLYGGGPFDSFVTKLNAAGSLLEYSTFLGGSNDVDESGNDIALDASGNAYVVGFTDSTDFPTTAGAFDTDCGTDSFCNNSNDGFVTKVNPDDSNPNNPCIISSITYNDCNDLIYSTYLGGSNQDFGRGIAVDADGNAYVTGDTISTDFPTPTTGPPIPPIPIGSGGGQQAFVTKLNAAGSALVYSTSLGGSGRDFGFGIAVEPGCAMDCNAYVMGPTNSADFPTTPGAFDTDCGTPAFFCDNITFVLDVFVAKLNATGSALFYSTFLGGTGSENFGGADSGSFAVDASGNAYVTGETNSNDFPIENPFQAACSDSPENCQDAFVTKVNPDDSNPNNPCTISSITYNDCNDLIYSTYLGGTGQDGSTRPDLGLGIAVDSADNAYVTGVTLADNFPTTVNSLQPIPASIPDAFVAKISGVLEVDIDIKPGSFPNSINLGSNGNVPVAIFSSATFDATTVDPFSIALASAPVRLKGKAQTPQASFEDVDEDGLLDLVVHVDTTAFDLSEEDKEAILEGQTFDGTFIRGVDTVRVVP